MSETWDPFADVQPFYTRGLISGTPRMVKSGKEATVFCCLGGAESPAALLALKVYRPRENRTFKNDAVYQEGRVIMDARQRRAVQNKSRYGRDVQFASWREHEFTTLHALYRAGADVPRPLLQSGNAILMEYIGDEEGPAPALQRVTPDDGEAGPLFQRLVWNIGLLLAHNWVHGDLSPFNILHWQGEIKVIDFPQAVDPRANAFSLLVRDVENVYRYCARYGVQADAVGLAQDLWT